MGPYQQVSFPITSLSWSGRHITTNGLVHMQTLALLIQFPFQDTRVEAGLISEDLQAHEYWRYLVSLHEVLDKRESAKSQTTQSSTFQQGSLSKMINAQTASGCTYLG